MNIIKTDQNAQDTTNYNIVTMDSRRRKKSPYLSDSKNESMKSSGIRQNYVKQDGNSSNNKINTLVKSVEKYMSNQNFLSKNLIKTHKSHEKEAIQIKQIELLKIL